MKKVLVIGKGTVIVSRDKTEEVSKGGIILAEIAQRPASAGVVIARDPTCVMYSAGDKVLFPQYVGCDVVCPELGERLVVLKEEDVLFGFTEKG